MSMVWPFEESSRNCEEQLRESPAPPVHSVRAREANSHFELADLLHYEGALSKGSEMRDAVVYKIVGIAEWAAAEATGRYDGSQDDLRDGYIHLSTAGQLAETAVRHFRSRDDLLLVAVDAQALGEALRYEPSRGGDLFPHLYGELPRSAVIWARPMVMLPDGTHRLPDLTVA